MKVTKDITVVLGPDELKEIIKEHLKTKGFDVKTISFDIRSHEQKNDYRAEFPLVYSLDGVICKALEL